MAPEMTLLRVLPMVLLAGLSVVRAQRPGQVGCSEHSVHLETYGSASSASNNCSREYLRCQGNAWRRCMCAGGVINSQRGECEPFSVQCPETDDYRHSLRQKREASLDCSRYYACPQAMSSLVIYPDWSNPTCDSYIVCADGQLFLNSCLESGYAYYNPRTLSCEEFPSQSNTCVFRERTDLSPITPNAGK